MSDSEAKSYHSSDGGLSPQPTPLGNVNHDHNTSERNNYVARPPAFSGDSIEFKWWKQYVHTYHKP